MSTYSSKKRLVISPRNFCFWNEWGSFRPMREISQEKFDAFAGFCRQPTSVLFGQEVAWFESKSRSVFALLMLDTDEEFSGILFARDLASRFRWVKQTAYYTSSADALAELRRLMRQVEADIEEERVQGDEADPVDFFAPVVKEQRFHERFQHLAFGAGFAAARELSNVTMCWYETQDRNYREQFQTTGFDARIWELYLFAMLVESRYAVSQPSPAPDFLARGLGGTFFIEATTINPSIINGKPATSQKPESVEEIADYVQNYLPIRFAGPLSAKLEKRYWESLEVADAPLVIAIQDFHDEFSMTYSGQSLLRYLYGVEFLEVQNDQGVEIVSRPVTHHLWKGKKIASGFFSLPDAPNISAVLFNASGTLAKFNRMGVKVAFGRPGVTLIHSGIRVSSDGRLEETFSNEVNEGYEEAWIDGMEVYHNPAATHPLNPDLLPGARHHFQTDSGFESWTPVGHLVTSRTAVVTTR